MQKVFRRVATAERQAAKRTADRQRVAILHEKLSNKGSKGYQRRAAREDIIKAKNAIKNDWHLGPLAPNNFKGDLADTYGAISETRYKLNGALREEDRQARCAWLDGATHLNLAQGDRVVLLEGPDKGKIGQVKDIHPDTCDVVVEGLNRSNLRLPTAIRGKDKPPAINIELPIPISAVRLVHPIQDPKTGETRDVIINQLRHDGIFHDRTSGITKWRRVVPGLNLTIPWPKTEPKQYTDHKVDTLRIDVEERTFVPTLLQPPIPEQVIDELRNKYSRFRTRHTEEYIAKKEAELQAKKDRVKLMDSVRTPLQEFHRAERERKKKKGKPRLTVEMLEEIGKVIAKNRERSLNTAGVSEISSEGVAAESLPAVTESVSAATTATPTPTPTAS
ncbi:uncharacterized protein BCR38DRAFT_434005 [Pseudomassariella vexata]|uniref:KOW domain-containing protein n=1 Tax=Pseudomassariella vexata TaxID=1141098 RepID=A0A1Y2DXR7_9PEZI|nr:uncharacterized protein BCR38DRAFT_434005 [Pseudomassariella vexata]ORY64098.1 hypothetical protein BCR38DRAFT_434005 [Pseudomassariella vexata]